MGKKKDTADEMMQEALAAAKKEADANKKSKGWQRIATYGQGIKTGIHLSINRRQDGLISLDIRSAKYGIKIWDATDVCLLTAILKENLQDIAKHFKNQKPRDQKTA